MRASRRGRKQTEIDPGHPVSRKEADIERLSQANPFVRQTIPNPFSGGKAPNPFQSQAAKGKTAQAKALPPIQRVPKVEDEQFIISEFIPSAGLDEENIKMLRMYDSQASRYLIITGGQLHVYHATGGYLIQTFAIKPLSLPFCYYLVDEAGKFWIATNVQTKDGVYTAWSGRPKEAKDEAQKKILDELDNLFTIDTWFIDAKEKEKFFKLVEGHNISMAVTNLTAASGKAAAGSSEGANIPPKPKWAKAFEEEMKKLLEERKKAEPASEDLPSTFKFIYSKGKARWRGMAGQDKGNKDLEHKIYLDVEENTDKPALLEQIRQFIRIDQLKAYEAKEKLSQKEATKLHPQLLWAYELKLQLDKLIAEEKAKYASVFDLPDQLSLGLPDKDSDKVYLQFYVYVDVKEGEAAGQKILKSASLPSPLNREMKAADILPVLRKATLALRGLNFKSESQKEVKADRILKPFPARIVPLNVRSDSKTVTNAQNQLSMHLDMASVEGTNITHLVSLNMRPVYFIWDVYSVNEQLNAEERAKMPAQWEERRLYLMRRFKESGQLKGVPTVNTQVLNELNAKRTEWGLEKIDPRQADTVEKKENLRRSGVFYGQQTRLSPEAEIKMPNVEGDYLLYCRAMMEPMEGNVRLPSEAFFPIHVQDGAKLAKESVKNAAQDNEKEALKKALAEASTEEEKAEIQAQLDAFTLRENQNLKTRTGQDLNTLKKALANAQKLKSLYQTHKQNKKIFSLLLAEQAGDRKALMEMWFALETTQPGRPLTEKLDEMCTQYEEKIKALEDLKERTGAFDKEVDYKKNTYTPIVTLVSEVTGQEYNLITMLGEAPDSTDKLTKVVLVDLTTKKTQKKYYGESSNPDKQLALKEATANAFKDFGEECKYGEGFAYYKIPGLNTEGNIRSKPGPIQVVLGILETVATVAAIAALVLGTAGVGGAAVVALGLGSAAVGAGLAAKNIYDRYDNHRLEADVELGLDLLNIAGPLLSGIRALNQIRLLKTAAQGGLETVEALAKVNKILRIEKGLIHLQRAELATNVIFFAKKIHKDWLEIENSKLPADKKAALQMQIIKNAIVAGIMFSVAIRNEIKTPAGQMEDLINRMASESKDQHYQRMLEQEGLVDKDGNWKIEGVSRSPEEEVSAPKAQETNEGAIPKASEHLEMPPAPASKETPNVGSPEAKSSPPPSSKKAEEAHPAKKIPAQQPDAPKPSVTPENSLAFFKQNRQKIVAGDAETIKKLLQLHGSWKDLIVQLQKKGEGKAVASIVKFRDGLVEGLVQKYKMQKLSGASEEPVSDVDLSASGHKAGEMVKAAEAEMASAFGPNWSQDLRMNFYTEVRRLTLLNEVMHFIGPARLKKVQAEVTQLTHKFTLAKMLMHAKGHPESEQRVKKLVDKMGQGQLKEIEGLAKTSPAELTQKRDVLNAEIDALIKSFDELPESDPKKLDMAEQIVKKQMEANFYTEEAYIGPGTIKAMSKNTKMVEGEDSMQGVMSNLEMIEHIVHQHKGDLVSAASEYEIYKYMYRISKAISRQQTDLFFDYLTTRIKDAKQVEGMTPAQKQSLLDDFMREVYRFLDENPQMPQKEVPPTVIVPEAPATAVSDKQLTLF